MNDDSKINFMYLLWYNTNFTFVFKFDDKKNSDKKKKIVLIIDFLHRNETMVQILAINIFISMKFKCFFLLMMDNKELWSTFFLSNYIK